MIKKPDKPAEEVTLYRPISLLTAVRKTPASYLWLEKNYHFTKLG
jgi:hypothetical protein